MSVAAAALMGDAGDGSGLWVVKVVDRVTGQCVLDSKGGGNPRVFAARVEAELDELSLEEFCSEWGLELPRE